MANKVCTRSTFSQGQLQSSPVAASDFKSAPVFREIENELNQVCLKISCNTCIYCQTATLSLEDGCKFLNDKLWHAFVFQNGAQYVKKIKGVFVFKVNNGPGGQQGVWVVDVKNGNGSVKHGSDGKCSL